MSRLSLRRLFLFLMLGSLAVAGVLGVAVLVFDVRFSSRSEKVIVTALSIALLSLTNLAYAWVWERGRRRPLVLPGAVIAGLTFLLCTYMIWADPPWRELDIEARLLTSGTIWAGCLLLLAVLALARVRRPWNAVNTATQTLLVCFTALMTLMLNFKIHDDTVVRTVGILLVLSACGAISVPILHRLSALRSNEAITTPMVLQIVCPRCGKPQELAAGHSRCAACGLRLHIEIEEERCAKCGYVLYRLTSDRCPECGTPVAAAEKA